MIERPGEMIVKVDRPWGNWKELKEEWRER
jgi:hypothetical protein